MQAWLPLRNGYCARESNQSCTHQNMKSNPSNLPRCISMPTFGRSMHTNFDTHTKQCVSGGGRQTSNADAAALMSLLTPPGLALPDWLSSLDYDNDWMLMGITTRDHQVCYTKLFGLVVAHSSSNEPETRHNEARHALETVWKEILLCYCCLLALLSREDIIRQVVRKWPYVQAAASTTMLPI